MLSGKLLNARNLIDRKCDGPVAPAGDEESGGGGGLRRDRGVEAQQHRQGHADDQLTVDVGKSQDSAAAAVWQTMNRALSRHLYTQQRADRKPLRTDAKNSYRAGRRLSWLQRLSMMPRPEARVFRGHGLVEQGTGAGTVDRT